MGALASLDQREEVRRSRQGAAAAGPPRLRRPGARRRWSGADAERGAFISPLLLRGDDAAPAPSCTRSRRSARSRTLIGYTGTADVIELAARGRGQPGRVGRHRRPGLRPRGRPRHRPLARPPAGARRRRRGRVHRPRVAAADARARRPRAGLAAARRWAACAACYHHMQRTAVQASPRMLRAVTGRWVQGRAARHRRRAPVHQVAGRAAHRRHHHRRPAHRDARGHRALRRVHRRHVLRAHGRGGRREEPVLRRPGRPRLPRACRSPPACSSSPTTGPVLANYGIDNLRFLTPVKPGDEMTVTLTCKQISPREDAATTARSAGTPSVDQPGRHRRWPPTTC